MPTVSELMPQMQQKTDFDLQQLIIDNSSWSNEALEAAKIELARRNLSIPEFTRQSENSDSEANTHSDPNAPKGSCPKCSSKGRRNFLYGNTSAILICIALGVIVIIQTLTNWLAWAMVIAGFVAAGQKKYRCTSCNYKWT